MEKKNVLIFTGLYLPGVKGGGPIRTIYNLTSRLKNDINFYIITLDRDLAILHHIKYCNKYMDSR